MEYSITSLARLAGVSTRTLRWYDAMGLLKPSCTGENGYRRYGAAEVDRLQDILFYRALGLPLARIRDILDDPSFDRLTALRGHLSALESERERISGLIRSVETTIAAIERKVSMDDELKFEALKCSAVDWNEQQFGREARKKYGDAEVDSAHEAVMGLTKEQYAEWKRLGDEIRSRLETAVKAKSDADSAEAREIVSLHRRWLGFSGFEYDETRHRGLAAIYTSDERFAAYYDRNVPGCAALLATTKERKAGRW